MKKFAAKKAKFGIFSSEREYTKDMNKGFCVFRAAGGKKVAAIAACLILAAVEFAAFYLCVASMNVPVAAIGGGKLKVVLDAGHGGIDGGVSGLTSGVKESDLNLAIVFLTADKLRDAGFEVTLTRKTEAGLYDAATKGFKKRDMQKRREIIEAANPAVVVSVHQNYYPSSFSRGGQAFYLKGDEAGGKFAKKLQAALNGVYGGRGVKKRSCMAGDFFMLSCSDCPSSLVECGFLSNPRDEALLLSDEFREEIAEAIVSGILSYFSDLAA